MEEVWKDIEGYEGLFEVSNLGAIRRVANGEIVHQYNNKYGYKVVTLSKNRKCRQYLVHRIVAFAFCEGYKEGLVVNHKNEYRSDNRAENLEWCTRSYNVTYKDAHLKGATRLHTRPNLNGKRKSIGNKFKEIRKLSGMKPGVVARMAVVSENTLFLLENGLNTVSFDMIESVANVYGYTFELVKQNNSEYNK